ncbi:phage tail assembly chaperone [Anaerovorax odorimutans]|uniref:phage tail assembly chaperone n=1 Tax=Anaerovorax odorimutans TaxID=109327 RepID=UPI000413CFD1|nr:phage portal protein [Anaerovorax odorimutans]
MSSLNAFLNPIQVENKEVYISERFKDDGKVVPFVIRPITQDENSKLIKEYTKKDKKGIETFKQAEYTQALTASAVVSPDLTNSELQKAYGVFGETNLLKKMLLVGEYANLSIEVQKLSGLDNDINDEIEEVKNE